ncbi:hypothetical protein ACHAP4_011423, partial [Fusarium culmorum]
SEVKQMAPILRALRTSLLLVLVRLPHHVVYHPNLDPTLSLPYDLTYGHHAPSRPIHPFTLRYVNHHARPQRTLGHAAATHNYGCRLPGLVGLDAWRVAVPGGPSPIPHDAET